MSTPEDIHRAAVGGVIAGALWISIERVTINMRPGDSGEWILMVQVDRARLTPEQDQVVSAALKACLGGGR